MKKNLWAIMFLVIAILGIITSSLSLDSYYKTQASAEYSSFCEISDYISCDAINRSSWVTSFGIPNALLGIIAYSILLVLSIFYFFKNLKFAIFLWSAVSLAFTIYLNYIEFFIIRALCYLCTISAILIIVSFIIVWKLRMYKGRK